VGSFECQCLIGFEGDGKTCTRIDVCAHGPNNCATHATCILGDSNCLFSCVCNAGYEGDGYSCSLVETEDGQQGGKY
jgi:hypothetical protein